MKDEVRRLEKEIELLEAKVRDHEDIYDRFRLGNEFVVLVVEPESLMIVGASAKAYKYYGYDHHTMAGMDLRQLQHELSGNSLYAALLSSHHERHIYEAQHHLADGAVRDVQVTCYLRQGYGRELLYLLVWDITEQKQTNSDLEASERKFRELFHASGDLLFIAEISEEGFPVRLLDVNNFACTRLGYSRGELLRRSDFQAITQGQDFLRVLPEWLRTGQGTFETELTCKDGSIVPVEVQGSHWRINSTKMALCIMRDLTHRKQAEAALRDSEERYRLVVEHAPGAVTLVQEGIITYANETAVRLWHGGAIGAIVGQPLLKFVHPSAQMMVLEILQRLEHTDSIPATEILSLRLDGSPVATQFLGTAFAYQGKRVVQAVFVDITERKQELARAAVIQMRMRQTESPMPEKLRTEVIYLPAQTISGDLFHFERLNDDYLLGLISDGSGKGVSAALNISAIRIAFHQSALAFSEPVEIIKRMNLLVHQHFEEEYVAACCFSVDFRSRKLTVASGGIHKFHRYDPQSGWFQVSLPGSPLGMFRESEFHQLVLDFSPGHKFWFYTDGLDDYFGDPEFVKQVTPLVSLAEQKQLLNGRLKCKDLDDDCTWVGMEIV